MEQDRERDREQDREQDRQQDREQDRQQDREQDRQQDREQDREQDRQQDDFMERANNPPERGDGISLRGICGMVTLACVVALLIIITLATGGFVSETTLFYFVMFCIGVVIAFTIGLFFWYCYDIRCTRRDGRVNPRGLHRRAPEGGRPVLVRRMPENEERPNVDAAGASRSSRAVLLDTASGSSGSQNPLVLYRSGYSCRSLQLDQQRTQAESTLAQEGSSLLRPDSAESSAASKMADVASRVSDISSKRTSGRERIRTRSITKKELSEASTSSAGRRIDPSLPGPSHLQSPERPVRHLTSRRKKTESESQDSERRKVLKSPVSRKSTASSEGVRRRIRDSSDSESSDSKED